MPILKTADDAPRGGGVFKEGIKKFDVIKVEK